MATYADVYDIWMSQELKKTVVVAVIKAATDILAEDAGTTNHANRVIWANATLRDPHAMAQRVSAGVVMNATIQSGTYTDSDMQWVVNGLVNTFATG